MSLVDRGVSRAHRLLGDGELVVASLTGLEAEGRRRRFVLVTERRVLVGWWRGAAPLELPFDGLVCRYEQGDGLLTLRQGEHEVTLRAVEEEGARTVIELLTHRRSRVSTRAVESNPAVRIVR